MAIKKYKPTSDGRRGMSVVDYREALSNKKKSNKKLTKGFRRGSGRNAQGRLTTRHKGGGAISVVTDKLILYTTSLIFR